MHTSCGEIDTTTNHPFYVIDKGWVAAGDLSIGDEVYLIDGSTAYVIGAELEKLDEPIKVYNLEVADFNTYFVGDVPVLVHNYKDNNDFEYPNNVKSGAGVTGDFTREGYNYRIDTNKVAPGEGGFHIHIYRNGIEVAKVNGKGGWVKNHKGKTLFKPSEIKKDVRNQLNALIKFVQKHL